MTATVPHRMPPERLGIRAALALRIALAVLAALTAVPTNASEWLEVRTAHFVVITKDDERHARTFAGRLERYDQGLRLLHHLPEIPSDKANPVTIYVVPQADGIAKLCAGSLVARGASGCRNIGGWYEGRVEGSVAFIPRPQGSADVPDSAAETMFHEYAHHFMLSNYVGAYPAWFVEGFAEFNATVSFESKGIVGFGKPHLGNIWWMRNRGWLPLETVFTSKVGLLGSDDQDSFYAEGWLLVHYLTFQSSRAGQLEKYLTAINTGKSSLDAARLAFGDLKVLERELKSYLQAESLSYGKLAVPELADSAIIVRRLTPGEAAMMPVRLQSDRGVDATSAKAVVAQARQLAAPWAKDPGAQIALAEAEYDADNDDAAEAAADRALAADPTSRTALEYKGMARVRRLRLARSTDARAWQEARSWFVKANHLDPNDARALYLFYLSFKEQGVAPTKSAVAGLEEAYAAVPQDTSLRWSLASQYLQDGRRNEARNLLVPLAYNPHARANNAASRIIALIDKGDPGAISQALNRGSSEDDNEPD